MKKNKRILIILLGISICLLIFNPKSLGYLKSIITGEIQQATNILELELPHSSQILHIKQKDQILQYWDGILYAYDVRGNQSWSINLGINSPVIEANDEYIYVLDGGKNQIIKILNSGNIEYRRVLNKSVNFIKPGDDKYLFVHHHPEQNRLRNVSVLNEEGKVVAEILVSEGEVINALVSEKNDRVILHTLVFSDGKVEGKLIYYNLKGEVVRLESTGDQIVVNMFFDNKGNLMVFYENKIASINSDYQNNWQVDTEEITSVALSNDYLITYHSNEGRGGIIQRQRESLKMIDFSGKIIGENRSLEKIIGVDTFNNDIIAYSSRTIYLLNGKGEILMEYKISGDLQEVLLLPNKHIGVITKEKLSIMKIQ